VILAIIQARMTSTRLPGKVLRLLAGEPMLARQLERIRRAKSLDRVVVATSDGDSDDPISELCKVLGVGCHRGFLNDVLARFAVVAEAYPSVEHVVRLTADCPLADPELIEAVVAFHIDGGYDYSSNTLTPTWPDGLDVEVFRAQVLRHAQREATTVYDREHVTPFMQQSDRFRLGDFRAERDLSAMRWTVDEPEDLALVERIYAELLPENGEFTTSDVLALLDRDPEIQKINARVRHRT